MILQTLSVQFSCSIIFLFSLRNQLERLILQTLSVQSVQLFNRIIVSPEESAWTLEFTNPTVQFSQLFNSIIVFLEESA